MGWHVVRSFRVMNAKAAPLRHELFEESLEVRAHVRVGILLDEERSRGVAAEQREKPGRDRLRAHPFLDRPGDLDQSFAAGRDEQAMLRLAHRSSSPHFSPISAVMASSTSAAPGPLAVTVIVEPRPAPSVNMPMIDVPPTVSPQRLTVTSAVKRSEEH